MGFSEMLLLAFLGYVLLGPRKTAELARELGKYADKWKRAAGELQEQFNLPLEAIGSEAVNDKRQSIIGALGPNVNVYGTDNELEPVMSASAAASIDSPSEKTGFASAAVS